MKPRLAMLIVAVILGTIAALGVNNYLDSIKQQAVDEQKTVGVLVASKNIEKGTIAKDIGVNKLAEVKQVPQRYVVSDSISSVRNIEELALSTNISAGEQLTMSKFKYPSEAGLSSTLAGLKSKVPDDYIAISLPYDNVKGVAGLIKPEDLVTVFGTMSPGPDGQDTTKIILQKVRVIAVGKQVGTEKEQEEKSGLASSTVSKSSSSDKTNNTISLALSPQDAEKLVFASEKGSIWLGLHPSVNAKSVITTGVNVKTVFK